MDRVRVGVIGAGVVGLSTALCVAETLPNCSVTVIAEKFSPHTTSDVAAGILSPHLNTVTPVESLRRWFAETFAHVYSIARSTEAPDAGVQIVSGWEIFKQPPEERIPFWSDIVLAFHVMSDSELKRFPETTFGWMYTTLLCECLLYLPWLEKRLKEAGVQMESGKVTDLWELEGKYEVVVNCAGLGAGPLAGDPLLYPVRGQVHKVHAPWLKHFVRRGDGSAYIYPGLTGVTLGGTWQAGDWRLDPDAGDERSILATCSVYEPSLARCRRLGDAGVGLRPTRRGLRLDRERLERGGRSMRVVHNYGHGGAGVSLHWGMAREAARLVKEAVAQIRPQPTHTTSKL
ncbi:D-aspartate oxidase [Amblyraja radiata]|uniref:D-aspartate oxidase n=1 Tax=Amblyraja radiata TaxID=386614 RepID=UPI0014023544|nr:D-aspartate oxidase [Amblyraja radiata]